MNAPAQITILTDIGALTLPAPCSLETALAHILSHSGASAEQVASAVNGDFVPRALRPSTVLKHNDTVLTFHAIVGG